MSDAANRTLSINRIFDAPLQLVWEAWTKAEHIAQWWGPKGMKTEVVEHDFRVGGKWHYVMMMPDGNEFITEGIYSKIIDLKEIFTSADFRPMTEGVDMQTLFEANGSKTNFTLNVIHPTEEYCRQQEQMGFFQGWGSVMNELDSFLQKQKSAS